MPIRRLSPGVLAFGAAIALAITVFVLVAVAPCDPNAAVLSDGTLEAPGNWGAAWGSCTFASAAFFIIGVAATTRRWLVAVVAGVVFFIVLWIAGASFWAAQCP